MSGAAFVVELTAGDEAALLEADPGVLESPVHTPLHLRQTAQCQGVGWTPGWYAVPFLSKGSLPRCVTLGTFTSQTFSVPISEADPLTGLLLEFLQGFIEINQITCLARCLVRG